MGATMARYKTYDYSQSMLLPINFSEQIIPGTYEYAIHFIVEERLDLSGIEKRYRNDETGAPAYDPRILLKIILLSYSYGTLSSRKIEKLCRENIIFRALTADQAPDFTTIAWFVRSLADEITPLFRDVLLYCHELGLLGGTEFALDGCKLSSNASKELSGTFGDLRRKRDKLTDTVKYLVKRHRTNDQRTGAVRDRQDDEKTFKRRIARMKRKIAKIDHFLESEKPKERTRGGEKQSNITDNESAKMKTSKGVVQGYNGMALTDAKRQVVIAAGAFGSGQEQELLEPMLCQAKETAGKIGLGKRYLRDKRLIADTGSFSEDNLKYLSKEKIDAYIPDQQFRKRDQRFAGRDRYKTKTKSNSKLYTKDEFIYDPKKNTFTCPNGSVLKFHARQVFGKTSGRVYRALMSICKNCKKRNKCLRSEKTRQRSLYVIEKFFNRNHSEEMMRKIDTPEGREIYSRRMGIVEPVFANIQRALGLSRFTLRSRRKVHVQWLLYCIVHNIGKTMRYGGSLA